MNPYSVGSPVPNLAPTINSFIDNLVKLKTHQDDIDFRGRQLAETTRQHDATQEIQQGNLDVARGNLDVSRQQLQAKTPFHLQPIAPNAVANDAARFEKAYATKAFNDVYAEMRNVAAEDPKTTHYDAYEQVKTAWPTMRDGVLSKLEKQITSEEFGKLPPTQQEAIKNLYDTVAYDKTGEKVFDNMLFKQTAASKKQEDENTKAALVEQKQGFQNQLLQQKFEQALELQGIKIQSAKELQDAKYQFLKDMKISGAGADKMGQKIMQGAYMEQLRDVDKQLREMNPIPYKDDAEYQAARQPLEERRREIVNDLKELSGLPVKKAEPGTVKGPPPGAQTGTYKGTRAYTTDGKTFYDMNGKRLN